ncbi:MAG: hydrogenase expression/formation protein HypE [Planctomycetales bacterium]|nr:hydrogenase expression/formation protein HypE [Planctomycetales bacterium]
MLLAHGEGGRLSWQLIQSRILAPLRAAQVGMASAPGAVDSARDFARDAAHLPAMAGRLAMTTDQFVVSPLFFPGGNIGTLSVFGTVNDLAVSGALPRYLTLSFVLEEGLELSVLDRVMESVAHAATETSIHIVAGDTKVVPRGAADGMFICTTGVGEVLDPALPGPAAIGAGDRLIVSGDIARHGLAVLCEREQLGVTPAPTSDCGSLLPAAMALRDAAGAGLRTMRDATRGGVAAVLHEWADECGLTLAVDEASVPLSPLSRGVCELLGLEPLHIANEGTLLAVVSSECASAAVAALRAAGFPQAAEVGIARGREFTPVTVRRSLGREQPLDAPQGAPLPRIC